MTTSATDTATERRAAIVAALDDIRALNKAVPDRGMLDAITQRLSVLASHAALFTRADFPPPEPGTGTSAATRYRLNPDDADTDIALYLNSINPGKTTIPHNHDTWAVIVAVEGQEVNRVYRRTDDRRDPAQASIVLERELTVQPGTSIAFLPDDLHSIHVVGDRPTLHFHLYGKPLETLSGRIGIEPDTGKIVNYNTTQHQQTSEVASA